MGIVLCSDPGAQPFGRCTDRIASRRVSAARRAHGYVSLDLLLTMSYAASSPLVLHILFRHALLDPRRTHAPPLSTRPCLELMSTLKANNALIFMSTVYGYKIQYNTTQSSIQHSAGDPSAKNE